MVRASEPVDKAPRCFCGHMWYWHEYPSGKLRKDLNGKLIPRANKACNICLNLPPLPLDGHTVEPVVNHIFGEYCIVFKWKKVYG